MRLAESSTSGPTHAVFLPSRPVGAREVGGGAGTGPALRRAMGTRDCCGKMREDDWRVHFFLRLRRSVHVSADVSRKCRDLYA